MKKRMRLLTATLAAVMTMSVCTPAKAAEYDTQQQEVIQQEVSVQEEEIILPADDNDVVTAENEDTDSAVTTEGLSEEAGQDSLEEEISAKEESPAEPEQEKTEQVEEDPEAAEENQTVGAEGSQPEPTEENGEGGTIDASVEEADAPEGQEAPVITDGKDTNVEETSSALKGIDESAQPKLEIIDTKIKSETSGIMENLIEAESFLKIAAPDASNVSGGRWEEIIEVIDHPEQGHTERVQVGTKTVVDEEAWDEQIYDMRAVCDVCGYMSDSTEDICNHLDVHYDPELGYSDAGYSVKEVLVETIHHPAGTHEEPVYENRWIVDAEAWSETIHTGRIGYVVN